MPTPQADAFPWIDALARFHLLLATSYTELHVAIMLQVEETPRPWCRVWVIVHINGNGRAFRWRHLIPALEIRSLNDLTERDGTVKAVDIWAKLMQTYVEMGYDHGESAGLWSFGCISCANEWTGSQSFEHCHLCGEACSGLAYTQIYDLDPRY